MATLEWPLLLPSFLPSDLWLVNCSTPYWLHKSFTKTLAVPETSVSSKLCHKTDFLSNGACFVTMIGGLSSLQLICRQIASYFVFICSSKLCHDLDFLSMGADLRFRLEESEVSHSPTVQYLGSLIYLTRKQYICLAPSEPIMGCLRENAFF